MKHYEEGTNAMREEVKGKKPESVLQKTDQEAWEVCKKQYYGTKCSVQTKWGILSFDPEMMKDVVGGEKLTYDEYLELMKESGDKSRHYFELCYYESYQNKFKGQIEKRAKGKICFKRILVSGMYSDGLNFVGREDHVWLDDNGFEQYEVGDYLSFTAEIYRYVKTGNGKRIDYALRNPDDIVKIDAYELPSDDDLLMQSIDQMICEVCMFSEHCYLGMCIANEEWRGEMRRTFFNFA